MQRILLACTAAAVCFVGAMCAGCANAQSTARTGYVYRNVAIKGGGFISGLISDPNSPGVVYCRTDVGGSYRWEPSKKIWIPLNDFVDIPDANLFGTESIAIDLKKPGRVFLAAGTYVAKWSSNGAIFRSDDYGAHFQRFDLPIQLGSNNDGRSSGERLMVDPNDDNIVYFGSRVNGLWRSTDAGATWSQVASFPVAGPTDGCGVDFVVFQKSSSADGQPTKTIYVGVSTKQTSIYRSTDAGATWAAVPGEPVGLMPNHASFDYSGTLYVTYSDGPGPNGMVGGAVEKLDAKSGIWTDITPENTHPSHGSAFGYGGLAVDAPRPGTLIVTTMDRWNPGDELYRTVDGGAHWIAIGPKALRDPSNAPYVTWHHPGKLGSGNWMGAIAIPPANPNEVFYGTGFGIWMSADIANVEKGLPTHWNFADDGLEETVPIILISPPVGPHLVSGVGDLGGFVHFDLNTSPAAGMIDKPWINGGTGLDYAASKPSILVRCGSGSDKPGYSLDGGASWNTCATSPMPGAKSGEIAISADGNSIVWSPNKQAPFVTKDFGATWTPCAGAAVGGGIASDRVNPSKFYACDPSSGTFLVSTDAGMSFHPAANDLPKAARNVRATPGIEGEVWLTADDALYHSADSGATFAKISTAKTAYHFGFGKSAPGSSYPAIFISGQVNGKWGVFRSDDGARSWSRVTDDQHQYGWIGPITGDPRIYGRVYFGTGGRGIIYADLPGAKDQVTASN